MPKKKKEEVFILPPKPRRDFLDRYWVFGFISYYPRGGLSDVTETNNDLQFLLGKSFDHPEDLWSDAVFTIFDKDLGKEIYTASFIGDDGTWRKNEEL